MPLVVIESLPPKDPSAIARMISDIRNMGAKAMECPTSNIWVIFRPVQPGYYAQGDQLATFPQSKSHPPIVIIRAHVGRTREMRGRFVAAVAGAVGVGLSISPENVWIHYQETRLEDVWYGGHWANGSAR